MGEKVFVLLHINNSMMKNNYIWHSFIAIAVFAIFASGCKKTEFKIDGTIQNADKELVVVEKSDFSGRWITIDSTRTNSSGKFSISIEAPAAPEIYRLCMNDRFIYFPIDSTENIHLNTTLADFGLQYELSGSDQAGRMATFDKELYGLSGVSSDRLVDFKKKVFNEHLLNAKGSIVSYYILTKQIDGKPLYDPEDVTDGKYFAAVATAYKDFRPDDPRTKLLEQTSLKSMKKRNIEEGRQQYIEAHQPKILEIELPDENGKMIKLSEVTSENKPTVIVFSLLNHPEAPELNRNLARIYESRKGQINIYQISLDEDRYAWREAARNIPWVTVYATNGMNSQAVLDYNVGMIPTFFIVDRNGDLRSRAENLESLTNQLSRY